MDNARKALAKKYNFDIKKLQYMEQFHSNIVKIVNDINPNKCDALITNKTNTPLMVMVADCIPILFFDPIKKVIGVAHAGREGTFNNIIKNTIDKMIEAYNCEPKDIEVELGPSIQKCCYEVSEQMAKFTKDTFGKEFVNQRYIDLQGINKMQLLKKGIKQNNISILNICTKDSKKTYFSYRNNPKCGRFAGLIMINE